MTRSLLILPARIFPGCVRGLDCTRNGINCGNLVTCEDDETEAPTTSAPTTSAPTTAHQPRQHRPLRRQRALLLKSKSTRMCLLRNLSRTRAFTRMFQMRMCTHHLHLWRIGKVPRRGTSTAIKTTKMATKRASQRLQATLQMCHQTISGGTLDQMEENLKKNAFLVSCIEITEAPTTQAPTTAKPTSTMAPTPTLGNAVIISRSPEAINDPLCFEGTYMYLQEHNGRPVYYTDGLCPPKTMACLCSTFIFTIILTCSSRRMVH